MSEPEKVIIGGVPSGVFLVDGRALTRVVHDFESISVDDLGEGSRDLRIRIAGREPVSLPLDAAAAAHLARLLSEEAAPSLTPIDAIARGVSRCGVTGRPTVSFAVDGEVVRYRLCEESAAFLSGALGDLDQIGRRSHSERVSGNPTSEVSTPFEGVDV